MGYSIYIAEDDKKIRELIHRFLESDGYAVISFENGDELLTAFRKNPADCNSGYYDAGNRRT